MKGRPGPRVHRAVRKQLTEDVPTFGEQRVRMTRLGSASSSRSTVGQNVSLDHRDAGEGVGKDSGGQQSTDGCTEDYGLPTDCPHQNSQPFDPYCRPCWVRACGERISGPPRPAVNSPTPYSAATARSCQHAAPDAVTCRGRRGSEPRPRPVAAGSMDFSMLLAHRLNFLLDQARLALDPRTVPAPRVGGARDRRAPANHADSAPTSRRARGDPRLRPGHPAPALERCAMIDTVGSVGATAIDSPLADV